NVFFHSVNVLLVFFLLLELFSAYSFSPLALALGASVFAVHPTSVEPVVWVTGLKDLLATFFGLLSLLLYLKSGQKLKNTRTRTLFLGFSSLCFLLALFSKPS